MRKLLFLSIIPIITSCSYLKTKRLENCEFLFKDITEFKIEGVNMKDKNSISDLNLFEGMKLTAALVNQKANADLVFLVDIKNPNTGDAQLNATDWILLIKDKEVLNGSIDEHINIPAEKTISLPLTVKFEVFKILQQFSQEEIQDIVWNLTENKKLPDEVTLKLRPTFLIAGQKIKYPGYIKLKY